MNAGIAPGMTNLLVADLLARHPEADEVELVFTVSVKGSGGPAGGHPDWLTATMRHRTTVVRLPEPFGRQDGQHLPVHDRAPYAACPANRQRGRAHRPPPAFRLHHHPGPRGDRRADPALGRGPAARHPAGREPARPELGVIGVCNHRQHALDVLVRQEAIHPHITAGRSWRCAAGARISGRCNPGCTSGGRPPG